MDMNDGGPRLGSAQTGIGYFLWCDRQMRRLVGRREIAGHGAGDENLVTRFTHVFSSHIVLPPSITVVVLMASTALTSGYPQSARPCQRKSSTASQLI
jgi:hypothetical protein